MQHRRSPPTFEAASSQHLSQLHRDALAYFTAAPAQPEKPSTPLRPAPSQPWWLCIMGIGWAALIVFAMTTDLGMGESDADAATRSFIGEVDAVALSSSEASPPERQPPKAWWTSEVMDLDPSVNGSAAEVVCSGCDLASRLAASAPPPPAAEVDSRNASSEDGAGVVEGGNTAAVVVAGGAASGGVVGGAHVSAGGAAPGGEPLPLGVACTPARKGDASVSMCESFCLAKAAKFHCVLCKCKSCSFCPAQAAPTNATV